MAQHTVVMVTGDTHASTCTYIIHAQFCSCRQTHRYRCTDNETQE